jgi:hypothetical protein
LDIDDVLMIQHFVGEGANVVVDEDEHLAILACHLKLSGQDEEYCFQTWRFKVWEKQDETKADD